MSKSPSLLLPGVGVCALLLGLGYGVASREYGSSKIEVLEDRLSQVEAKAAAASDTAAGEKTRAAELEAQILEIQSRATVSASLTAPAPVADARLGLGRAALPQEVAAWDVDVLPDGRGLPVGSGDVFTGEEVFADQCASCHGDFAEGVDNWPVLAGGFDTLGDKDPVKTVGSYWPHLSTLWDYVHRSMPFGAAGTLSADDTYAIVAYILYSNDLVDDDFELNQDNFKDFEMYNAEGFIIDDRPELEYAEWQTEPCMENCKDEVQISMRSVFLVETPAEGGSNSVMNHASSEALPSFTAAGASFIPEATAPAAPAPAAPVVEAAAGGADDLIKAGEKVFRKCKACHAVGAGAKNKSGPQLNGVIGRPFASVDGFAYSAAFKKAAEEGRVWDEATLAEFLAKPKSYIKGTKMAFAGLKKDSDLEAIAAYLKAQGDQ